MKTAKRLVLILGDQLSLQSAALDGFDRQTDTILMVESRAEASHVLSHQAKIVLFLSAMRHFAQELRDLQYPLIYIEHATQSISEVLRDELQNGLWTEVVCIEPGEWRLKQAILEVVEDLKISIEIRDDDHFFCSPAEFKEWAADKKELRLEYFYRLMRKRHDVLVDKQGEPEGGQWNFDQDNRKPYPKQGPGLIEDPLSFPPDHITQKVIQEVKALYPNHPGSVEHFNFPVTRSQALEVLHHFKQYRLRNFGVYQDAMWTNTPFGWHSMLSSSLNLKLLNPREVINTAIEAWREFDLDLSTIEGFIRQILGWREFVRGMYFLDMPGMATANHYEHQRKLPAWYWSGNTQMRCMQDAIGQTLKYGYAHHIQRLMVTGNFALLAEILPSEVCDWYLAIYVDAIEWVELPNTAGMALYANGGRFTSKPYVASGAYIKRMSNYCQGCQYQPEKRYGPSACPVTTLYWNFLLKHRQELEGSPRTRLMTTHLKKMSEQEQDDITAHATYILNHLDTI